jgi:O-acetyl-ADP-ribose deacetylase (regulator of RNase III)
MTLHHLIGDATDPVIKPALICHVCNDCHPIGKWGAGFVVSLSKKNEAPEDAYLHWALEGPSNGYELGAVQLVPFAEGVTVANMIAQHDTRWKGKIPPIRYDALETCLTSVYKHALENKLTVAMPRIGCVLAGGSWDQIEAIIKKVMTVDTYVYTLESQKNRWPTQYEGVKISPVMVRPSVPAAPIDLAVDYDRMKIEDDSPRDVDGEPIDTAEDLSDFFK